MKEKERLVYLNNEFIPERDARISIFDSALMFGDMVFEITCSFNKVQFKLDEHIKRLYSGIKMLEIPLEMNPEEMEQAVFQTIEANDHLFSSNDEHRVMIDVCTLIRWQNRADCGNQCVSIQVDYYSYSEAV